VVIITKVSGVILEQKVTLGQAVHDKERLFTLGAMEAVSVVVSVPKEKADALMTGQEADIILDSYPDATLTGAIEKVETAEESSVIRGIAEQGVRVFIRVKSEWKMKAGLSGYVWIKSHRKALMIPKGSLLQTSEGKPHFGKKRQESVFIVENARAKIRAIHVGTTRKNMLEVLGGIQEGQAVVARGVSILRDNDRIKLKSPVK
jgi:multidrug efflux pump subunit AcrA (membrane-fusion protein)